MEKVFKYLINILRHDRYSSVTWEWFTKTQKEKYRAKLLSKKEFSHIRDGIWN